MTPRLSRLATFTSIFALALAAVPAAHAAVEEGDAGDLTTTAQDLGAGPVAQILGSFSDAADVDVYRICLSDGDSFSATTVGATTLDTQMFLFNTGGFGIYANDDFVAGQRGSTLPAHHAFSPASGGEYFLAISSYNRDPQSSMGEIFEDNFSRLAYPDGVVDANGFGGAEPLSGWDGRPAGGPGLYRITLTGTTSCTPPDTTAPTVDLRSPADGAQVPQGASVEVDFSCADEGSSGLASCAGTSADGALLDTSVLGPKAVTVTARDGAGNTTVVTHTVTVVDVSAPDVTIAAPLDGAEYARHAVVNAAFACADEPAGSGVESCEGDVPNGDPVDTTTLGPHSFTVDATDRAGNHSARTVTYTVVDETAPAIDLATPADGAVYGLGETVAADYSCADEAGGSGLASCVGTVADGAAVDTSSVGEKSFRVDAIDAAGNASSRTVAYSVADRAGPGIEIATPAEGAVYSRGQRVLADYSCVDQPGGSGVATCAGSVPDGAPVDTSGLGPRSFTVTATDKAGNTLTKTVSYSVGYTFTGFMWPVKNPPKVNVWKAGVPVPIRFSLDGFRGSRPEADGYPRSTRCGGGDVQQAGGWKRRPAFDYSRRLDQYVLLWDTERRWAGSCREFQLKLNDGTVRSARFEFVKKDHRHH